MRLLSKCPKWIVNLYLFLMLGVFPLYYQNKYYNMGDAKYAFFKYAALGMFLLLGAVLLAGFCLRQTAVSRLNLSFTDLAVLAYIAAAVISWILSPYRTDAWLGSDEWYMGLFSQLLFTGIYFAVSRFGTIREWPAWVAGAGGGLTFLLAYLHRFRIDPLGLYEGISDYYQVLFLGTIGQATWYSSYICVVLPVMMGIYMTCPYGRSLPGRLKQLAVGGFIFLGFATSVTQNSDSVYIGLGLALLFLLWFALENGRTWRRYLEILLLGCGAAKLTGLLQTAFPERVPDLEPLSIFITQSSLGWILLTVLLLIYALTLAAGCCLSLRQPSASGTCFPIRTLVRRFRLIFYVLIAASVLALPVLMWMATTGRISVSTGLWQQTGYLIFDETWGSGRGKTWRYAVKILNEFPLTMKLFGCGPDAMTFYSEALHAKEIEAMWGGLSLTNAHNEWLTALIDYGFIGFAAYLAIFLSSLACIIRSWRRCPVLLAFGAAIVAYMGHNFFCYQQAVCTPLIFIAMAAAQRLSRDAGAAGTQTQNP